KGIDNHPAIAIATRAAFQLRAELIVFLNFFIFLTFLNFEIPWGAVRETVRRQRGKRQMRHLKRKKAARCRAARRNTYGTDLFTRNLSTYDLRDRWRDRAILIVGQRTECVDSLQSDLTPRL